MQGVQRYKVRLLPHDEMWEKEFWETKAQIQRIWPDNIIDIQHFGSTAVKGILAKPILDVAVVLKSFSDMDVEAMCRAGYDYCGLQKPDNDRYLFVLRGEGEISLRHIHCYEPENQDFKRCIGLRDYLNTHPNEAFQYSELKHKLAEEFPEDRFAYTDGKWDFVQSIYRKLGL
jgi:GrpB-like predicted nucleotidyltransferase (UPF0157 family)